MKIFNYKWISDVYDDPHLWISVNCKKIGLSNKVGIFLHKLFFHSVRMVLRFSDLIIVSGSQEWLSEFKIDRRKISQVTNGVDTAWVDAVHTIKTKNSSDRIRICYVGHLKKFFGIETMLQAAKKLKEEQIDFELVLIGPTEPKEEHWLTASIQNLDLHQEVIRTGRVAHEEAISWIRSADICLYPFPKTKELEHVYPIKLFEYLACGKVTISSRLQAIESVIDHEKNGLLVNPSDSEDLASAVIKCIRDKQLRHSIERNALLTAKSFDWNNIMAGIMSQFHLIASK